MTRRRVTQSAGGDVKSWSAINLLQIGIHTPNPDPAHCILMARLSPFSATFRQTGPALMKRLALECAGGHRM